MKNKWYLSMLVCGLVALAACAGPGAPAATPTVDPAIYNQVQKTTVFEPGQCQVVLNAPAPAYTSNTIGGQPSGQIAAGTYEVGVAAQSFWVDRRRHQ